MSRAERRLRRLWLGVALIGSALYLSNALSGTGTAYAPNGAGVTGAVLLIVSALGAVADYSTVNADRREAAIGEDEG